MTHSPGATRSADTIETLIAKEAIRELVLLYSRGVDRKDAALLRTLYTHDATDHHADSFQGTAVDYVRFLEASFPYMRYSGHHICNHLIAVDGEYAQGEVYALAFHVIPDRDGGWVEDFMCCRYMDRYRRDADGHWRFASRVVTYDWRVRSPVSCPVPTEAGEDKSYAALTMPLFARLTSRS